MKTSQIALAFLTVGLFAVSAIGQSTGSSAPSILGTRRWGTLVLTRDIVRADSVRVSGDKGANLVFAFIGKTQQEIERIKMENLGKKIMIKEGDEVRAVGVAGGGLVDGTNTIGMVLIFESKGEAKIAARVLRGQKDELEHRTNGSSQ